MILFFKPERILATLYFELYTITQKLNWDSWGEWSPIFKRFHLGRMDNGCGKINIYFRVAKETSFLRSCLFLQNGRFFCSFKFNVKIAVSSEEWEMCILQRQEI